MTPLEKQLEGELLAIYTKCGTIGYYPTYFKRMLTSTNQQFYKGPVRTVRHLMVGKVSAQSGFRRLVKAGKLEWTVEWLIANNPRFHPLFQNADWVLKNANARVQEVRARTEMPR